MVSAIIPALYRSLAFEVHRIALTGIIPFRRGRVTQLYAYEDSQAVAQACRAMADLGITEATAPTIES